MNRNRTNLNPNGLYYAYLRKSRADRDAEARGEGETLARHQKLLTDLAASLGVTISRFYKEIVSGENIKDRPVVQELLRDISTGACDGVFVVEVERLARGDTSDQGTIANYFKLSDTLIVTPLKIYDPNDEYDEEYFEFGLFMSRREYKTINRRIQRGRRASVEEGKWIASTAPYGYERIRIPNDKGYTLKIVPEEAEVVRLIFDLYTTGEQQPDGSYQRLGHYRISKKLDSMGVKPRNSARWSPSSIKDMLRNPTYIGKVTFGKEQDKKIIENGVPKTVRVKNADYTLYNGLHPAIISEEQFYLVQQYVDSRPIFPVVSNKELKNPLSGLIRCTQCGSLLTRAASNTKTNYPVLKCSNRDCSTVSAPLYLIEEKVISSIAEWFEEYKLSWTDDQIISNQIQVTENALASYQAELATLNDQKNKAYDFLEQGIYTPEVFSSRISLLDEKMSDVKLEISKLEFSLKLDRKKEYETNTFLPRVEKLLNSYWDTEDSMVRNHLLQDVVLKIDYTKNEANKKFQRDNANFKLKIYPKLPV